MATAKRGKRTTVSAIYEVLAFGGPTKDDAIQKIVKMNPSKNVVRVALRKLEKAGQKEHGETLQRAADKLGYVFRGTTYVVGKNKRLIIPVDISFAPGSKVIVYREKGLITVKAS